MLAALALAAAGLCAQNADCVVPAAACIDGACRLSRPMLLFPSLPALTGIELVDPVDLAQVSATPEFHWTYPLGASLIAVAVFRGLPSYIQAGDRIANFDEFNVRWIWHSNLPGAGIGRTGVLWQEGLTLTGEDSRGIPMVGPPSPPPPLAQGIYYWAAWGWTGVTLANRSELRTFVVGPPHEVAFPCRRGCDGRSNIRCTAPEQLCVAACASDRDCFAGEFCDLQTFVSGQRAYGLCRTSATCNCLPGTRCVKPRFNCVAFQNR